MKLFSGSNTFNATKLHEPRQCKSNGEYGRTLLRYGFVITSIKNFEEVSSDKSYSKCESKTHMWFLPWNDWARKNLDTSKIRETVGILLHMWLLESRGEGLHFWEKTCLPLDPRVAFGLWMRATNPYMSQSIGQSSPLKKRIMHLQWPRKLTLR